MKNFFLFISVQKIIKIDQDFPKLWSQMYCHLFLWFTVYVCVHVCPWCRKLSQLHELPVTESPALSPCVSVAGRESPATLTHSQVSVFSVISRCQYHQLHHHRQYQQCRHPHRHCVIIIISSCCQCHCRIFVAIILVSRSVRDFYVGQSSCGHC